MRGFYVVVVSAVLLRGAAGSPSPLLSRTKRPARGARARRHGESVRQLPRAGNGGVGATHARGLA